MTDKKICPLCGSDNIEQKNNIKEIYDPFGGHDKVTLAYDSCQECGMDGDFADTNDTFLQVAIDGLKSKAVINILQELADHKANFAGMERALELPQRTLTKWKNGSTSPSASGVTLLKFLKLFPWLLLVAENKFDFDTAQRIHLEDGIKKFLSEVRFSQHLNNDANHGIEFHIHINQTSPLPVADSIETPQFYIT